MRSLMVTKPPYNGDMDIPLIDRERSETACNTRCLICGSLAIPYQILANVSMYVLSLPVLTGPNKIRYLYIYRVLILSRDLTMPLHVIMEIYVLALTVEM
jgi:hypothetical protein